VALPQMLCVPHNFMYQDFVISQTRPISLKKGHPGKLYVQAAFQWNATNFK